jgi:hypothetical protein
MKSTDDQYIFDIMYGKTAMKARNHHPNRFNLSDTFVKNSDVSSHGLIHGIYQPLFCIHSATLSVLNVIQT